MRKVALCFVMLALVLSLVASSCCSPQPDLIILHAGSLAVPFDEMAEEFENSHPGLTIVTEAAGSRETIRKVTELGKPCDVIGSADYAIILPMMEDVDGQCYADWYIAFARNQMVIAYRDDAPFADEVKNGERTWYDVFANEDVTYGHADPDVDPCGYRTLMVVQLAENYYAVPGLYDNLIHGQGMDKGRYPSGRELVKPKETDLLYLLQSRALDYAFEYRSVAEQHGFEYLELPDEIDLSNLDFADLYATAQVEVTGKVLGTTTTLTGAPIVYAITIPKNAPHPELAIAFVEFLLGPEGQATMERCGQPPIVPAVTNDLSKLPEKLRGFVTD